MDVIHSILTWNEILTVSILGWLTAQLIKTTISSLLAGKLQLERMVGDGGMPSAHSATVCAMVVATGRIEGVHSSLFAIACVVAIITMHDAMGVRHETGEQAKVLNNIIEMWLEESESRSPFLQNMHLKEMVGHTPLQVYAGMIVGAAVGFLYPLSMVVAVSSRQALTEGRKAAMGVDTPLLDSIKGPEDVKCLSDKQVVQLCGEIRRFLVDSVLRTGGHLASNLGTVELTVALHRVLNSPQDKIVFDVGHQCYTHKLLTGRKAGFARLRQKDGISGFPNPRESRHDAFVAGHGNTALSLAIGMAWAKKLKREPGWVVAVIGDGAFTGGMVYEGMNNISSLNNLMVILNDNGMSISKNVGAMARYLTHLRASPEYFGSTGTWARR